MTIVETVSEVFSSIEASTEIELDALVDSGVYQKETYAAIAKELWDVYGIDMYERALAPADRKMQSLVGALVMSISDLANYMRLEEEENASQSDDDSSTVERDTGLPRDMEKGLVLLQANR